MKLELIATATFGLEAVVRREIEALGFRVTGVEDGRISYIANEAGLVKSNLWLRTADRVLLKMGAFEARTFEELFQGTQGIAWETLIPENGNFIVNCTSVKSTLSSVPACQSVAEKALVSRLQETYGEQRFVKTGAKFDVKLRILKDFATVTVDTSGIGLHKRGYRTANVEAPIKETLAAALVQLSFWKPGRLLVDPFCGSGTISIEAAMIGCGIAPGRGRKFAAEDWGFVPQEIWAQEREAADAAINRDAALRIHASDRDPDAIDAARENAGNAGVEDQIVFETLPFARLRSTMSTMTSANPSNGAISTAPSIAHAPDPAFADPAPTEKQGIMSPTEKQGIMVCNPPYGERTGDQRELAALYKELGGFFAENPGWSLFLITADKNFEAAAFSRPASRRRKLYNGRIETTYYQYHGVKELKET